MTDLKKNIVSKLVLFSLLILGLYIIYSFPIQKYLANANFRAYVEHQGADMENIQRKAIIKDYKQNGYWIDIIYRDDPDWTYSYHFLCRDIRDIFSYKSIRCYIFNSQNESYDLVGGKHIVKYPPIEL